jgi:hypothetical protein
VLSAIAVLARACDAFRWLSGFASARLTKSTSTVSSGTSLRPVESVLSCKSAGGILILVELSVHADVIVAAPAFDSFLSVAMPTISPRSIGARADFLRENVEAAPLLAKYPPNEPPRLFCEIACACARRKRQGFAMLKNRLEVLGFEGARREAPAWKELVKAFGLVADARFDLATSVGDGTIDYRDWHAMVFGWSLPQGQRARRCGRASIK